MSSYSSFNALSGRGLFSSNDSSKVVCARPKPNEHGEPLSIGISFKSLMTYITITCLGLTTISALMLIWRHLHRYTAPKEQRQNIRIIFMPVFFCIISLLSILFYDQSIYLKPVMQVYEAFCVAALFFLFLEYVCPEEDDRAKYFSELENKDKKGNIIPGGSQLWFNRTWAVVLQYPLTKTLSCIVEISTQAANVYCANSISPRYAHFWLQLIDIFIIGGAITAVFRFYGRLKLVFDPKHHALAKLVAFKGIVIFQFFQDILFGLLNGKTFKPSARYTYDDLYYGLPMMLTALEAFLFSLAFHWAFRSREYHEEQRAGVRRMPIWKAALDAMNLMDIIRGIVIAFKLLIVKSSPQGRGFTLPSQFGAPKRQRTQELDSMAFEPLQGQQGGSREPSPAPGAYRGDLGVQRMGVTGGYAHVSEMGIRDDAPPGYEEYRNEYLTSGRAGWTSRSPSPSPSREVEPRNMV